MSVQPSGLQWGHLSLEVVILGVHLEGGCVGLASMGPPLFRGGHLLGIGDDPDEKEELQWGHLSLEVVMFRKENGAWTLLMLQWGHLSLEVVIPLRALFGPHLPPGFNGATSL